MSKKRVLVMSEWYEPGYRAGGPIRSAVNFVHHLKEDLDLFVFTTDRDMFSETPYPEIQTDKWFDAGDYHLHYATPVHLGWKHIVSMIREVSPDYIFLNSMFAKNFTLYPLLAVRSGKVKSKLVLSVRGMLKKSALAHKAFKKKVFLSLFDVVGLDKYIVFHATDEEEKKDIQDVFGKHIDVHAISNFPGKQLDFVKPPYKEPGQLKILFVGRIHPIKNLEYLLNCLKKIHGRVDVTVIGAKEDVVYWQACEQIIQHLPADIHVNVMGELPHQQINEYLIASHVFTLPTKGENFGHAILEGLLSGRPVVISDQTPWRDLMSHKAGFDIPLRDPEAFCNAIQQFVEMGNEELIEWCKGAWQLAHQYGESLDEKKKYLQLFR